MKFFVSVLLISTFMVLSQQQQPYFAQILPAWRKAVEPYISECLCQSHANQQLLDDFFNNGRLSDDPCFKCNIKCLAMKLEVMNSAGEIIVQKLVEKAAGVTPAIGQKCKNNSTDIDLCQRTYDIALCLMREISFQ